MNGPRHAATERCRLPYRAAKLFFLLSQGAVLPLAMLFIFGQPETLWRGFLIAGIYLFIPFWAILFMGIALHRFPLQRNGALMVAFALLFEFAAFYALGRDVLYSMYALFITSFAGTALALLRFVTVAFVRGDTAAIPAPWRRPAFLAGLFILLGIFLSGLSMPLIRNLTIIPDLRGRLAVLGVLLFNIVVMAQATGRDLGQPGDEPEAKERYAEWERWAPATAIVLVLSLTGAVFAAVFP